MGGSGYLLSAFVSYLAPATAVLADVLNLHWPRQARLDLVFGDLLRFAA